MGEAANWNAADTAVEEVLGETDGSDVSVADPAEHHPGEVEAAESSASLCSAQEATDLVAKVKDALAQFDDAIQAIIRLRAWEPLGYPSPRELVLGEFGPIEDPEASGRVSRVHAYRLARLAMFMYGLSQRLGDDEVALEVSERALRSVPAGAGGENDMQILERIEERVDEVGGEVSSEQAQEFVNEELQKARQEIAAHGSLDGTGEDPDQALDPDRLAALKIDPESLAAEADAPTENTPAASQKVTQGETDEADGDVDRSAERDAPEQSGASREGLTAAYGSPEAGTGEALERTEKLAALRHGLESVAAVEELVPTLLDYATDEEVAHLVDQATVAEKTARALIDAAEQRAGEQSFGFGF